MCKYWILSIISCCVLMSSLPPHGYGIEQIEALRGEEKITIDGRLNEPAWETSRWYSGFTIYGDLGRKAVPDSEVAVLYDDQAVYFGFIAHEPEMGNIQADTPAGMQEDYGNIYRKDESFELMISTGTTERFFQFLFNPNGAYWSTKFIQGGAMSVEARKNIQVASSQLGDRWMLEVSIPFSELDMHEGDVSEDWLINVVRNRLASTGKRTISTLAPVASLFDPEDFARAKIPDTDFSPFKVGVENWRIRETHPKDDGSTASVVLEMQIKNSTGDLLLYEARVNAETHDKKVRSKAVTRSAIDSDQLLWFTSSLPEIGLGKNQIEVEIYNTRLKKIVSRNVFNLNIEFIPFELFVDRPMYRAAIYHTMDINEVQLGIRTTLSQEQWKGHALHLEIFDPDGKRVGENRIPSLATVEKPFAVEIPALSPGVYICKASLLSGEKELYTDEALLHVYPPSEREVRVDDHLRLIVDGRPFFPIGTFQSSPEYAAELGLDHIGAFARFTTERLDQNWKHGIRILPYVWSSYHQWSGDRRLVPLTEEDKEGISRNIQEVREHPAIMGYYIADEPELVPWLAERLRGVWELIKEEDPYHPALITITNVQDAMQRGYTDVCDIIAPDIYPNFSYDGGFSRDPRYIANSLNLLDRLMNGRKMLWFVPQAFDLSGYGAEGHRAPTYIEQRLMVFLGIVHGARGISWWTAEQWPAIPDMRVGIPALVEELRAISVPLLGTEDLPVTVKPARGEPEDSIHVLARVDDNGDITIIACNVEEKAEVVADIRINGLGDKVLNVVSENRNIYMRDGFLRDSFKPLEVHIYTTAKDEAITGLPTVEEIKKAVAEEDARRDNPKNVAFYRRLKSVRSSRDGARTSLKLAFNGYREGLRWVAALPPGKEPGSEVWIEAEFDRPRRISLIEVSRKRLPEYRVELLVDDKWVKVDEVRESENTELITTTHNIESPAVSRKLRLTAFGKSVVGVRRWQTGNVFEIAAYESE